MNWSRQLGRASLLVLVLAAGACGSSGGGSSGEALQPPTDLADVLDMAYRGAFRLPSSTYGASSANYAVGTLAYNPTNHSLFIAGSDPDRAIGEFAIPQLLVRPTLAELDVAPAPLQNFRTVLTTVAPEFIDRITGMLYVDGQLVVNAETWYDGEADNRDTTLVIRNAENLGSSAIDGYFEVEGGATAAGYMAPIPPEWQASLGGEYLTGWSSVYSINGRYSIGPSLFVPDMNRLLGGAVTSGPVSAEAFMNFPFGGGNWLDPNYTDTRRGSASPLWNLLSRGVFGFIVPGTNTFAVLGSSGGINSGIGYKITQNNGNLCGGHCSYDADDNYNYYWLFDLNEILNASAVYDIQPYDYGIISVPFDNGGRHDIIGGTFDPDTGMVYLALSNAGGIGQFEYTPLIVGYQVPLP